MLIKKWNHILHQVYKQISGQVNLFSLEKKLSWICWKICFCKKRCSKQVAVWTRSGKWSWGSALCNNWIPTKRWPNLSEKWWRNFPWTSLNIHLLLEKPLSGLKKLPKFVKIVIILLFYTHKTMGKVYRFLDLWTSNKNI